MLSLSRIPAAALFLVLYSTTSKPRMLGALLVLLVALGTDVADGILARRLGVASERGYIIDGLGDRSVYIAIVLTFNLLGHLSLWLAWLLVLREVVVYGLRLLTQDWLSKSAPLRRYSLWHAATLRSYFGFEIGLDASALLIGWNAHSQPLVKWISRLLLIAALSAGYYGLALLGRDALRRTE